MLLWPHSDRITVLPYHYQSTESTPYLHHSSSNSPSLLSQISHHSSMPTGSPNPPTPTVRVHHSTPSPAPQSSSNDQSMLTQSAFVGSGWGNDSFPGAGYLNTIQRHFKGGNIHKRKSSGSSITSAGPPSPLDHTTAYPQIATSDSSSFSPAYDGFEYMNTPLSAHTSKSLPTPADTPTSNSFMASGYHNVGAQNAGGYTPTGMRRIQSSGPEDEVSYAFSGPQSVSSMSHNSPATPHTNYEVDYEDSKHLYQGQEESVNRWMDNYLQYDSGFPTSAAFNQAMQDVFPDQIYPAAYPPQAQQTMSRFNPHVSPHRAMFANRLQAANHDHLSARTNSPITSVPRDQSPFRQNSPFVEQQRVNSQMPSQQMNTMQAPQRQESAKSVSPKELMLDEHDIDEAQSTPLFPEQSNSIFSARQENSNMSTFQPGLYNSHYGQTSSVQMPQQYPFVSQRSRPESGHQGLPDQTPEFPAHMVSMESTVEEGPSEPSSQHLQPIRRPDDTTSDGGTYTCTYHGCSQRFETPAKLQKHKREGHRQVSPSSAPTAQSIAFRNSQAGPHKCERINPSTGKPCNSIFSRPYDLTRHEDTIHNSRKMKVRCHLCTEEKTFSRNDALTRHMRVVHPDVDWPGKTRRKNGRD